MSHLSTPKRRKTTAHRGSDSELAERVKAIRVQLELSQAELAARLNVSRPQVGEWERGGDERPSPEKLLELAELAPEREDRIWFWKKAGVNLDAIKADFREEVRSSTGVVSDNEILKFPIIREFIIGRDGNFEGASDRVLKVPVEAVAHPASVICLEATKSGPWAPQRGEVVLVDRSLTDPTVLRGKQVAVFFDPFPVCYESLGWDAPFATDLESSLFPQTEFINHQNSQRFVAFLRGLYPAGVSEGHVTAEVRFHRQFEEALRPGFLVGWLHQHSAQQGKSDSISGSVPWCWTLVTRVAFPPFQVQIALSSWWVYDANSDKVQAVPQRDLFEGVKIIGEVINWYAPQ